MPGRIVQFTTPFELLYLTSYRLSMSGRIGQFTALSGLLNLTLYNEEICEDMRVGKNKDIFFY